MIRKFFVLALSALFLMYGLIALASKTDTAEKQIVANLFEQYHEFKLAINPLEATKAGDYRYNDRLANYISDDYQAELIERYTQFIGAIESIDQDQLPAQLRLSLQAMLWDCHIKREGLTNKIVTVASPMYDLPTFELMPVLQITSLQLYFTQLAAGKSTQPFNTVQDYDKWLMRVEDYLTWLRTARDKMEEGVALGLVPPRALIVKTIPQLDDFVNAPVREHLFYTPIRNMPGEFSASDRKRLTAAYEEMIEIRLKPEYARLRHFMVETYLPAGRSTSGIGALENGAETYNYLIRLHTSTTMSADEIFALGEQEVARIQGEMERVRKQIGYKGDLQSFLADIRQNKKLMPFTRPQQVIDNFNKIHLTMQDRIPLLFAESPKAGFEVRRTEAFREASASAEYLPGTSDASRPGIFYIPIPEVSRYNSLTDEALFLHEAIPGHHYQLSLQQENENLPAFMHAEGMGVFVEGWALYAESLGRELGLYTDPYQYFGMLSMEMHRAIRLVVDTGIHAKGWTREQAIAYSLAHEAESEAAVTAEIERYMATPGQALSYKIGQLKIQSLREKSRLALGENFDIREFHHQILGSGSLPLVLLEEKIDAWIASMTKSQVLTHTAPVEGTIAPLTNGEYHFPHQGQS